MPLPKPEPMFKHLPTLSTSHITWPEPLGFPLMYWIIFFLAALFLAALALSFLSRRLQPYLDKHTPPDLKKHSSQDKTATDERLQKVAAAGYKAKRLLNAPELRLLPILDKAAADFSPPYRVMAQTSLGEILDTPRATRYQTLNFINAKRLDFLIIDNHSNPVLAIEYQGSGHYQKDAEYRDEVKRIALESAEIAFYAIPESESHTRTKAIIRKKLREHHRLHR